MLGMAFPIWLILPTGAAHLPGPDCGELPKNGCVDTRSVGLVLAPRWSSSPLLWRLAFGHSDPVNEPANERE